MELVAYYDLQHGLEDHGEVIRLKVGEKILLLSWGVPPDTSGSAFVVANLAAQFSPDQMIVAGEKPHSRLGSRWSSTLPPLRFIRWVWPFTRRGIRWWRLVQLPFLIVASTWLILRHSCRVILTVFPDEHFLLASYIASRVSGARLYPYFHNTYLENRSGLSKCWARWLQGQVFEHASHVFVMSEGMVQLFREKYPRIQCSALPHIAPRPLSVEESCPALHPILRLSFCGSINHSCQDAMTRLVEAVRQSPNTELLLISGMDRRDLRTFGGLRSGESCKMVTPEGVQEALRESDILLLPHGFSGELSPEEYRTIFPTKIMEYLIAQRPILAHVAMGTYLHKFLLENGCALVVDKADVEVLKTAIATLRTNEGLRNELVANSVKTLSQFSGETISTHLREVVWGTPSSKAFSDRQT